MRILLVSMLFGATPAFADGVWEAYDQAIDEAVKGEDAVAAAKLAALRAEAPDHPASVIATEVIRLLEVRLKGRLGAPSDRRDALSLGPQRGPVPLNAFDTRHASAAPKTYEELGRLLRREEPTSFARAELAFGQTINGIVAGAMLCSLGDCNGQVGVLTSVIAGGAGLGASLLLTDGGITPGRALAANSGAGWGVFTGLSLFTAISSGGNRPLPFELAVFGGQLVGTSVGLLVGRQLKPAAGDVALGNFTGIWAAILYSLTIAAIDPVSSSGTFWFGLAAIGDLGVLGGALLATKFPMSRGRIYVLDAGGILGGLLGVAIVAIAGLDGNTTRGVLPAAALLGASAGIAAGAALTTEWDFDAAGNVAMTVLPTPGGAMIAAGTQW